MTRRRRHLAFAFFALCGVGICGADPVVDKTTGATWITHPEDPGPDIPTRGQSLFDSIFTDPTGRVEIPYPFSNLVEQLEAFTAGSEEKSVLRVMVPKGRSLQRAAADPDYFRYPRHILALQGEGRHPHTGRSYAVENRFYLAYQEKAAQLEIISYNEDQGRFEFQTVEHYGPENEPVLGYASRATCMTCHQNGGAIFPRSPWRESNYNPGVARNIARDNPGQYAGMLDAISFDAAPLDYGTDYANYSDVAQLIWIRGCGNSELEVASAVRCRAALLNAVLQYRLSGGLGFASADASDAARFAGIVGQNWADNWPRGLLLPNADIPDRDPGLPIDAELDPVVLRPPKVHWLRPDDVFFAGIVEHLSVGLLEHDVATLDAALRSHNGTPLKRQLEADCSVVLGSVRGDEHEWSLHCDGRGAGAPVQVDMDITLVDNSLLRTVIRRLVYFDNQAAWQVDTSNRAVTENR